MTTHVITHVKYEKWLEKIISKLVFEIIYGYTHGENFRRGEFLGSSIVRQNETFDLYYCFRVAAALV